MERKMHKIQQLQEENKHTNFDMVHKNKYVAKVTHNEDRIQSSYRVVYDEDDDDLVPIHQSRVLPWQLFTRGFTGQDYKVDDDLIKLMD
jgi:hypothetical protein